MQQQHQKIFQHVSHIATLANLRTLPAFVGIVSEKFNNFSCRVDASADVGSADTLTTVEMNVPYDNDSREHFDIRINSRCKVKGLPQDEFLVDHNQLFKRWKFLFITGGGAPVYGVHLKELHKLYEISRVMESDIIKPAKEYIDNIELAIDL